MKLIWEKIIHTCEPYLLLSVKPHKKNPIQKVSQSHKYFPKVAVVILNWNGVHFLQQFLPSVLSSNYDNLDIYVADNASTDNSIAFVQEHFSSVKIIQNNENYGFAEGYNQALEGLKADYYVLLNSDVEVTENWIQPIIDLMESQANIAACQPKILALKQKSHFEYAGAAGGWMDRFGYMFCRGRFFEYCEEDKGQYETVREVFWATGCAMFIRAELYHAIGGLDGDFFAHMEEIDLCWRLKRAGYAIYCHPQSVVYHVGGGTLPQGNSRKLFLNFRNSLAMLFKNLTFLQLWTIFPARLALDGIAALQFLAKGDWRDFGAVVKAEWHFFTRIFKWMRKRRESKRLIEQVAIGGKRNNVGIYKGSIVFERFLKKKDKIEM